MNIKTVYYQFREYNHSHIESLSQQKGESSSELELLLHEMKHKAKKQNKTKQKNNKKNPTTTTTNKKKTERKHFGTNAYVNCGVKIKHVL